MLDIDKGSYTTKTCSETVLQTLLSHGGIKLYVRMMAQAFSRSHMGFRIANGDGLLILLLYLQEIR